MAIAVQSFVCQWLVFRFGILPVIQTAAEIPAEINFSCNSRPSEHGAQRGGKHALEHNKRQLCLRENYRQFFGSRFSDVNGFQT